MKLATALALLVSGCGTSSSTGTGESVVLQSEFDLTAEMDRAYFEERDVAFVETLGPYALFEVTGPSPALVGPLVEFWGSADGGFAMLCGANNYFANDDDDAMGVQAQLLGGPDGDRPIVTFRQAPIRYDGCTGPREDTAVRMPEDDLEAEQVGEDPDAPMSAGTDDMIERLVVSFDPAPNLGSYVLLQRVALSGARPPSHARSHSIPQVCCEGKTCLLR